MPCKEEMQTSDSGEGCCQLVSRSHYLRLVCLTIENFIPMEQYQQIVERAHFDESSDEWVISNVDLAGNRIKRRGQLGQSLAFCFFQ